MSTCFDDLNPQVERIRIVSLMYTLKHVIVEARWIYLEKLSHKGCLQPRDVDRHRFWAHTFLTKRFSG